MIKSIEGKTYNSSSAKLIGYWTNAETVEGDANFIYEALHRKRTGEYFLHGKGGPATRYGKRSKGASWKKSESIIPLTKQQAKDWAKEHLSDAEYEMEFEIIPNSAENRMLTLYLPVSTIEMIRRLAVDTGHKTMSGFIDEVVRREYLAQAQENTAFRKIFQDYAEAEGKRVLEEYETALAAGDVEEVPAELDAKCRAIIDSANQEENAE